uniref:Ubiquitinyl hydrolase 1 n=1 Tax=Wuchereria bancrofti TaxID=6293 RepID=A0AAF5Q0P1_WUCBA
MTIEKSQSNEFIVKVRRGRIDQPVFMKKKAVMTFNHDQKDITFSYDNCCTVLKTRFMSQVPWSPPRGCKLRFISDIRNEEEMILEFENHEKLMEAFSILKDKYLERSQFVFSSEVHSGRGLHTTNVGSRMETSTDHETLSMLVESRRSRVKDQMFERLAFSPPTLKRSRQSEPRNELTTEERVKPSPSTEKYIKPLPLRSGESEKVKSRRNPIFVEYSKREHTPVQLASAMRTLDDYQINKPTTSQEKVSGFANLGNTCYMNAMLQGLFAMDIFVKDLFKLCKKAQNRKVNLDEVMPMSLALSSLASMRDSTSDHQKRKLLTAVKDVSRFKGSAQQDANEFLVHVLNQVHDECDNLLREQYGIVNVAERRMRNPVMANFAFTMQSTIICNMCHHVSQINEDNIILPVTINILDQKNERFPKKFSCFPSMQTLLDDFLKAENVERKCELCQGESGQRTQKFVQLPRCLIILIKRYVYDASKSVKRADKIDIPLYLTLNGHCTESPAPFFAVSLSTKKVDFATVSPIKTDLIAISSDVPSPTGRRLDLSDEGTNYGIRNVSPVEEAHRATRSFYSHRVDYRTVRTDHGMGFVVPGIGSEFKGRDQVTEDFVVPWSSAEDFKRSKSSLACEELSCMSEEEQLQVVCERSLMQTELVSNQDKSSDSSLSVEFPEVEAEEEIGESRVKPLAQSPITGEMQEKQRQDNYAIKETVAENFDVSYLSQERVGTPAPDAQEAIEDKKGPTRPSTPVSPNTPTSITEQQHQEKMSRKNSLSSNDDEEILEESSTQLVPYKPISVEKRRAICSRIGLLFNYDCIEKTAFRIMNTNDRPSRVADIVGDGNCLFRALAFYFAGSDIEHSRVRKCIVEFEAEHWNEFAALKDWSSEIWNDHMNHLLTDNTWGTEIELFAVAAMLNVDVWTYYDQRWICYRPRFRVQSGDTIRISVDDYRVGDNDGIYLLNEFNHFTPVLEPSNALLLMEGVDERIYDLVMNAKEGFMKPSYRLVSVISHLGRTSESGHYVCDVWCKKNKGWLVCDDETISPISERRIRARKNVGYIYFYLNSELFDNENA